MMRECFILIDYANFYWNKINMPQLVNLVINSLIKINVLITAINIRIYGGWFFNETITEQRIEAIKAISNWPNIIRVLNKVYRINYTFADSLCGFTHNEFAHIKQTFIKRREKLRNIRFQKTEDKSKFCTNITCSIEQTNKWLKSNKACINSDCPKMFSDCFVRFEQKQVDAHIIVDFMHLIKNKEEYFVFIMSNDIDFLPAIQYAIANGIASGVGLLYVENLNPYMYDILNQSDILALQIPEK